jgi:hypothetical protein
VVREVAMRKLVAGIVFSPMMISAAVYLTGCFRFDLDCELNPILECGSWTPKGTGSTSSSSSSSSGTGGGPAGCEGDPTNDAGIVRDQCFAFASAGAATGGKGTKAAPFASLQEAIDAVKGDGRRVLACSDQPFAEEIVIPAGAEVVGGFDCAEWGWTDAARTTIAPGAGKLPLKLTSGSGTTVLRSLAAIAANAMASGASSIAAIVDGGGGSPLSVEITQCDFSAGKGAAGAKGTTPLGTGEDGAPGNPGNPGCADMNDALGGSSKAHPCGAETSIGGSGGIGSIALGGDGSAGKPSPQTAGPPGQNGEAGQGEDIGACTQGGQGAAGTVGDPGTGATGIGIIDAKGFSGTAGAAGTSTGKPGQGGGGGGGAKAGHCMGQPTFSGPSGGGGGSGGCGGLPASGGGFGGSSIGILSLNAQLELTTVTIAAKDGGTGGNGGDGQPGGAGGNGGGTAGNNGFACQGGKAGQGGLGGAGGGGLGGHSLGLAVKGPAPTLDTATQKAMTFGAPGDGGLGGNMDLKMNDGAAGVAAAQQVFN